MKRRIGVIGGGASGMMAAICAAEGGAEVTIIEHMDRLGKKILMTGNGKCNFTNSDMRKGKYYGTDPSFAEKVIGVFDVERTLRFFDGLGLLYRERNGYYYPLSNQASSVLDVLRFRLLSLSVTVVTGAETENICVSGDGKYCVSTNAGEFVFDRLILACGGMAYPKTGSDGSGFGLAKALGHTVVKPVPALVQLVSPENYFRGISGVRTDAQLTLWIGDAPVRKEAGELQITDYGISGIPVFQFSRIVSYGLLSPKKRISVEIDCVPGLDGEGLFCFLHNKLKQSKDLRAEEMMQGFLNKKLNLLFLKQAGISPSAPCSQIKESSVKEIVRLAKHWSVPVCGTKDFSQCQVCAGGVCTEELTPQCESRLHGGLYFAGEMIDIDGICGGYNLQWAFSSGAAAGMASVRKKRVESNDSD